MAWPDPLAPVLAGAIVRLEPLGPHHADALFDASRDPAIWRWMRSYPASRQSFDAWFEEALRASADREEFAFATVRVTDDVPIGSTRFLALRPQDLGLEIGWTWLNPSAWRTGANVEAKLLQLAYAFEELGCIRVELKTHAENQRSRDAMTAMGAWFEGIHRKHRIVPGIGIRDTAWFSVVDDDWPAMRQRLRARLTR
jgi:RimJ/RimL family protein N-acetyltransferase